jgi:hypothetical protein
MEGHCQLEPDSDYPIHSQAFYWLSYASFVWMLQHTKITNTLNNNLELTNKPGEFRDTLLGLSGFLLWNLKNKTIENNT